MAAISRNNKVLWTAIPKWVLLDEQNMMLPGVSYSTSWFNDMETSQSWLFPLEKLVSMRKHISR